VQLLVEECEERLSETKVGLLPMLNLNNYRVCTQQVEELISLVRTHLPDTTIHEVDGMKLDNTDVIVKTDPSMDDT
jgi:hypothetical protein